MKTKLVKEVARAEKASRERQTCVISFRVAQDTKERLAALAEEEGCSLGEYARDVLEGGPLPGEQLELDLVEEQDDEDRGEASAEQLRAFLENIAKSAKSLARGWVRAKMVPKVRAMKKRQGKPYRECDPTKPVYGDGTGVSAWICDNCDVTMKVVAPLGGEERAWHVCQCPICCTSLIRPLVTEEGETGLTEEGSVL